MRSRHASLRPITCLSSISTCFPNETTELNLLAPPLPKPCPHHAPGMGFDTPSWTGAPGKLTPFMFSLQCPNPPVIFVSNHITHVLVATVAVNHFTLASSKHYDSLVFSPNTSASVNPRVLCGRSPPPQIFPKPLGGCHERRAPAPPRVATAAKRRFVPASLERGSARMTRRVGPLVGGGCRSPVDKVVAAAVAAHVAKQSALPRSSRVMVGVVARRVLMVVSLRQIQCKKIQTQGQSWRSNKPEPHTSTHASHAGGGARL